MDMMEEKKSLTEGIDPEKWEYDGGPLNFTGEADKLSPHIREVQEQIVKDAFGE
jgi:hypothetical protein